MREVGVSGEEGSLAVEGGGETVDVREFVLSAEFCGLLGDVVTGVHKLDGKLGNVCEELEGGARHGAL